LKNIVVDFVDT